jgi:hypothetical protein
MNDQDKLKVKESFERALSKDKSSDDSIPGMSVNGQPATKRLIFQEALLDDSFYNDIDDILTNQGLTLDEYLDAMEDHPSNGGSGFLPSSQP